MAFERVTLYGLPLVPRRRVDYAQIDPELARELFIRHALVEGDWQTRHHFFRDNARLREELDEIEERARRRDLLVGDDEIYAFYDARIPADVVSARHFDAWWKKQRHHTPDLLTFTRDDLLRTEDAAADQPDTWQAGDLSLPVTYRFEPGADDDGVTVHVPVEVLARLGGDEFAWQVPALREELVTALIRSLPKDLRRNFVPAPDTARAVLADPRTGNGTAAGVTAARVAAAHRCARADRRVRPRASSRAPAGDVRRRVRGRHRGGARQGPRGAAGAAGRAGPAGRRGGGRRRAGANRAARLARRPRRAAAHRRARQRRPHRARASRRSSTRAARSTCGCSRPTAEQDAAMGPGIRRLLRLAVPSPVKAVERQLNPRTRLVLGANPDGSLAALLDDCADAAVAVLAPAPVWSSSEFAALRAAGGRRADVDDARHRRRGSRRCSPPRMRCRSRCPLRRRRRRPRRSPTSVHSSTGCCRTASSPPPARRISATSPATSPPIGRRLERLPQGVNADRERMPRVHAVQAAYDELRQLFRQRAPPPTTSATSRG